MNWPTDYAGAVRCGVVVITPVIGVINRDLTECKLTPNPDEVAAVFTVPLAHLLDPANRSTYQYEPIPHQHINTFALEISLT